MSGYGGQPPGWDNPYGQQGGGWDPYGEYAQQGYGPPGVPYTPASQGAAIAALVCNIVATLCCLLGIPGIVTAAIALGKVNTEPESARTLTIWSWVIFAITMVLGITVIIIAFAVGAFSEESGTSTY